MRLAAPSGEPQPIGWYAMTVSNFVLLQAGPGVARFDGCEALEMVVH